MAEVWSKLENVGGPTSHPYGIQHHPVAVRHPRANGQVERANSTMLAAISTRIKTEATWDKQLAELELVLNTSINQTIGVRPFYALYGFDAVIRDGLLDTLTTLTPAYQQPAEIQQQIRQNIAEKQAQWKAWHDQHRKNQI
ncbi:uncharacterized protein LOC103309335 [Acyrthosiphon pisum]|uniref:Integrase catalytic domain-containing protein n=1 Tax=Acyrthosiphon pisum TaxID=7029 RepID=A0A8R2F7Y1_ACYPI|nr:uncharacterized protein LOC103309335 [Acyrthosiphon pisum]|eukprot:XP_008182751.1 PREDICTED: uncharacterized protein LOC103309335 [Acyrthosiphon pisum]